MNISLKTIGLDETIKNMMELPGKFQKARDAALTYASAAFLKEMKANAQSNALGWDPLAPHSKWISSHPSDKQKSKRARVTKSALLNMFAGMARTPWGKILGTLAFNMKSINETASNMEVGVLVGFKKKGKRISLKAGELAKKVTEGFTRPASEPMRKYLAAIGVPIRPGTSMKTPARPLVEPSWERFKGKFIELFQNKFLQKIFGAAASISSGGPGNVAA